MWKFSEHWLHHYDLSLLSKVYSEFYAYSMCSKSEEDGLRCTPRCLRGSGGVSILWHKTLHPYVQKLTDISNDRAVASGLLLQTAQSVFVLFICQLARGVLTTSKNVYTDYLDAVVGRLAFDNDVIIMGDFNADPGSEGGPLSSTPTNEQGRILLCYLQRWNYLSVHLYDKAPGLLQSVTHTYCSEAHNTLSTIDHILSPQHLLSRFSNSFVLEEEPTNLSDHSPVCTNFECDLQSSSLSATSGNSMDKQIKVNWAKLSKNEVFDCYTTCVESKLSFLTLPNLSELVSNPSLIDTHLESIVRIFLTTALDSIPIKKFSPHIKPGWTPELNSAHGISKCAYKVWVAAGCPRRSDHPLRKCYKEAKANFRAELRRLQASQRDAFFQSLDINCQDSAKLF